MELAVSQKRLGAWALFVCVIGVELIQILTIDMYAPALPTMSEAFGVSALYLNNTVFSFLFASTIAMVLSGPISDRFGRKPVFLAGRRNDACVYAGSPDARSVVVRKETFIALILGFGRLQVRRREERGR